MLVLGPSDFVLDSIKSSFNAFIPEDYFKSVVGLIKFLDNHKLIYYMSEVNLLGNILVQAYVIE